MSIVTEPAVAGVIAVVGRRTPLVLSVARRLREGAASTHLTSAVGPSVTVRLRSATDAQQAYITVHQSGISICADGAEVPDIDWQVTWTDPAVPAEAVEQAPEPMRLLAKDLQVQLAGAALPWTTSAKDFWDRTHSLPGMPSSLRAVCTDPSGEEDRELMLGEAFAETAAYEIHATDASLTRLFGGRSLIMDELLTGEMAINGGFPEFSALLGAFLKVVCGEL